jgi:hypothetical protein
MRRGAALAAVLLALALANALVVGAVFVARRQAASARVDAAAAPLQPLAERALVTVIAGWDSVARSQQPVGSTVVLGDFGSSVTVWITRTSPQLYWLVGESRLGSSTGMSRRVGAVVISVGGSPRPAFPRGWAELP